MHGSTDSIPKSRPDLDSRMIVNSNSQHFNVQAISPSMNSSPIPNGVKPRLISMDDMKIDELPPEIPMVTMGGPDPNIAHHRYNPTLSSELDIKQDIITRPSPSGNHYGNHRQNERNKKKKKRKRNKHNDHGQYAMNKHKHNPSEGMKRMMSDIKYMQEGQRNSQHHQNQNMNMRHGKNYNNNYHQNGNNMNPDGNLALPGNYQSPGPDLYAHTQK